MIKRLIRTLAGAVALGCLLLVQGCKEDFFTDEIYELHQEIERLNAKVDEMNTNIVSVQTIVNALQNNDYVTSVTPVEKGGEVIGYTINFSKSGAVTIYHGEDGHTPKISVKQAADGIWYWTLDGEWLLDGDGKKISSAGITPKFKIEGDKWFVSYDEGKTWKETGTAKGDSMFEDVVISEESIQFVLAGGETFLLPRHTNITIGFDVKDDVTAVFPGRTLQIGYTLANADENTLVSASSNGAYVVNVNKTSQDQGMITIKCPSKFVEGYVNVHVSDGRGYSFLRVISFYENRIEFPEGMEYHVSASAQTLAIPYSVNFDYVVKQSSGSTSWLKIQPGTRAAMSQGNITLDISANQDFSARTAKLFVCPVTTPDRPYREITITQSSAYFSISKTALPVPAAGLKETLKITSSLEVVHEVSAGADWVRAGLDYISGDTYNLNLDILANHTGSKRNASIRFYTKDRSHELGVLEIVQMSLTDNDYDDMIFVVRANMANDFIVYLPLSGNIDCYIDWGDGSVEKYVAKFDNYTPIDERIHHHYDVTAPTNYTVRISGKVTELYSANVKMNFVTDVLQWGNTGLTVMEAAFSGNTNLKTISDKGCENWGNITSFGSAFSGCSSLTGIPENLFAHCPNVTRFAYTFSGCSSLTSIPENLFAHCPDVTDFGYTFSGCSSLTSIPENLFANCPDVTNFAYTFSGCRSLTGIPENLFAHCPDVTYFGYTFRNCSSLTRIPENLFAHCPDVTSFHETFYGCRSLTGIPAGLFRNNRKVTSFDWTFYDCRSLTGESPYDLIEGKKVHLYERADYPDYYVKPTDYQICFSSCSKLSDWEQIPWYWK